MARPFNVNEAEDLDLNLLVNWLLEQRPEFLPTSGSDGNLFLLPYAGGGESTESYCLGMESFETDDSFNVRPAKNELLM